MRPPSASRRFKWLYAAWLFGLFAYFLPGPTWNPVSRFDLTRSLVEHGSFEIDWLADDTGDKALANGHWYSDKAPLPALAAVPLYAVLHVIDEARGRAPEFDAIGTTTQPELRVLVNWPFARALYLCSLLTAAVAGTAIGLLIFELLSRRGAGPTVALFGSLALTLGTPVLPYATSFYGHVCAGACVLGGLVALSPEPGADWASPARQRWAGAALAAAVGCEYITAIPVACILGWALVAAGRQRLLSTCANLALGAVAPVALVSLAHTECYGAPWRTGYSHIASAEFAAGHAQGLLGIRLPRWDALVGLVVGPRRGLVYIAPITALMAAWWAPTLRQRDWLPRAAATAVVALLLANAGYYMWWGGAAAGPRHLVPVVPLLALGTPAVWGQRGPRWAGILLAVVSGTLMLGVTAVGIEAPERVNLLRWMWAHVAAGSFAAIRGSSNLGILAGLPRAGSLGPLLAWAAIGLRLVWKSAARLEPAPAEPT